MLKNIILIEPCRIASNKISDVLFQNISMVVNVLLQQSFIYSNKENKNLRFKNSLINIKKLHSEKVAVLIINYFKRKTKN